MPSLQFNNFKLAKVRFRFQALIAAARLRWELQLLTGPSQDKTEASENSASSGSGPQLRSDHNWICWKLEMSRIVQPQPGD